MQKALVNKLGAYLYKGAIHIHTKSSDGTGDINSISKAAKKAGLDWIIITDHNFLDNKEGFFNGVYVIKGQEISPQKSNHYLAFDLHEVVQVSDNPQDYIENVRKNGGFGFAAHPDEGMNINKNGEIIPRENSYHCIPWTDKSIKPDGVEIWNWFSNWADNLNDKNIFTLAYAYFFKHRIITNPSKITLSWWDNLNNETQNIIPAIGGVDAHALKIYDYILPLTIFPYETCFGTITNVISLKEPLSKDFQIAKRQILNSIIQGNNIILNRKNNNIVPNVYISNSKTQVSCGESINIDENTLLNIEISKPAEIKLILNGNDIELIRTTKYVKKLTQTGKYRVEFFYKGKGFAYTNPIVVK